MSDQKSNSGDSMVKFLKERIESNQGISLQNLTGHLSQLPCDLRTKYGSSVKSLKVFLERFPEVFVIGKHGKVYVRTKSRQATSSLSGTVEGFINSTSERGTDLEDVNRLTDVRGTVYRLFSVYGFISMNDPIKGSVYFDVKVFENAEHCNLFSSGLRVGDCVVFDAKVGPKNCEARFRAIRVTRTSTYKISSSPTHSAPSVNDVRGRDRDTTLRNELGVIETVKANYGFIKFGRNERERAFFHAKTVEKALGRSIKNLPDVLTVEDKVRFNAKPSMKPSDTVKWEATAVDLCRSIDLEGTTDPEDELGNEVFMSDDESDIQDFLPEQNDYKNPEDDLSESPVGYGDWFSSSVKVDSCGSSSKENGNARMFSEWEGRQKFSGERGFFYPMTESLGRIKFGPDRGLAATAAVEVTYNNKEKIGNLLWEVADGQEVSFDVVQAEENTWIATLVWIGERPAKPLVGDSEHIFNSITNKSMGAHNPLASAKPGSRCDFERRRICKNPKEFVRGRQTDSQDGEKSPGCEGCEDFETEVQREYEAPRGPSFVPLAIGLPDDTVPSRESGPTDSVSLSRLLAAPPAGGSTPTNMRSPGAHNQSLTHEIAPVVSLLFSEGSSDAVRLRLAKMVAAEIMAEKRRLRAVLREVAVQTVSENTFPSTSSGRDGLAPDLVSSSNQTVPT